MSIQLDLTDIDSTAIIISTPDPMVQKQEAYDIAKEILEKDKLEGHPDFITINTEENSIGIDEVKKLILKIQLKPYQSKMKVAWIETAEKLTTEAQNAFLKTLEDIPNKTIIILTTSNHSYLLPTILSRCKVYEISSQEKTGDEFDAEKVIKSDLMERFKLVEVIANMKVPREKRESATSLIKTLAEFYRSKLHEAPKDTTFSDNLKLLQYTMTAISKNVNLRLSLENLMINLK